MMQSTSSISPESPAVSSSAAPLSPPLTPESHDATSPLSGSASQDVVATWRDPEVLLQRAAHPTLERIQRDRRRVSPRLRPMLEHIERYLFDPQLNVNRLKQACSIRDNSIAIHFHSQIGQSPKAYLSQRRLETASRLLRDSDLRVWRIAEMVGYSSLGVFSKAFNRWAKHRPMAFRRQARELVQDPPVRLLSTVEFMDRALSGALTDREARHLVDRLLELYPEVPVTSASRLRP